MSDGLPDLSSLSPEQQQALFALSTEEERQSRLAHAKAQAQALMEKQQPIDARTPLAGAFEGISNAANSIGGRLRSDDADRQAKAMDAQHISGLQGLMAARRAAYNVDHPPLEDAGEAPGNDWAPMPSSDAPGDDARAMGPQSAQPQGLGSPLLDSLFGKSGQSMTDALFPQGGGNVSPEQQALISALLKKQPGQQLADAAPTSHDYGLAG